MSKTKHPRKRAKKATEAWAVTQDGKPVMVDGLDGDDQSTKVKWFKVYARKEDAQRNCWMGGQEVQRVLIRVI